MRWWLLFIAAMMLSAPQAQAQSVYSVLSVNEVIGTWSHDCAQPSSESNPRLVISAPPTGYGRLVYDRGAANANTVFIIRKARDLSAARLLLHQSRAADDVLVDVVLGKEHGKIRLLSESEIGTGKELIRDGVTAATGQQTPWLAHCR